MIHTYRLNGFNMIIDAASGAVHSVDDVAYDAIERLDTEVCRSECDPKAVLNDSRLRSEISSEIAQKHGITIEDAAETLEDIAELSRTLRQGTAVVRRPFRAGC